MRRLHRSAKRILAFGFIIFIYILIRYLINDQNVALLKNQNRIIKTLSANIEYLINYKIDPFIQSYATVFSDLTNNEIFNKYNKALFKADFFNKAYLNENRRTVSSGNATQDIFLVVEYTTIGKSHKYCDMSLNSHQKKYFNDKNNVSF